MNNPMDFTGKVALVTGAAAGMGLATARAFAEGEAAVQNPGNNPMYLSRRKFLNSAVAATALAVPTILHAQTIQRKDVNMNIQRAGTQPSTKGPTGWFTGTVRLDSPFKGTEPSRVTGATVSFEPGARTAWHTHPLGQTLLVLSGCGWAQRWGGPIEEIRPGDIVWFPAGEKHWHGANPTTAMSHIAIQEALDGRAVDWMEKVTDDQYRK